MAKLQGGIFSKPSGQTAGLVFGSARTREGKVATVREKVFPSNPQTTAQTNQRSKFSQTLGLVRLIGKAIYASLFNRAVGQLAGFQSLMSTFIKVMATDGSFTAPPTVNTGDVAQVTAITLSSDGVSGLDLEWSTSRTFGKTDPADQVGWVIMSSDANANPLEREVITGTATIASGAVSQSVADHTKPYIAILYIIGGGANAGLFSATEFITKA